MFIYFELYMKPLHIIGLPLVCLVGEYFFRNVLFSFIRLNADALSLGAFSGNDWIGVVNAFAGVGVIIGNAYSGVLSDIYGRVLLLRVLAFIFSLGLLVQMVALLTGNMVLLCFSVFVMALGAGVLSVAFPAATDLAKNDAEVDINQYTLQGMIWGGSAVIQVIGLGVFNFIRVSSSISAYTSLLLALVPYILILLIMIYVQYRLYFLKLSENKQPTEPFSILLPITLVDKLKTSNMARFTALPFGLLIFTMHSINTATAGLSSFWDLSVVEYNVSMLLSSIMGFLSAMVLSSLLGRLLPYNTRVLLIYGLLWIALALAIFLQTDYCVAFVLLSAGTAVPFLAGNLNALTTKSEPINLRGATLSVFNMLDGVGLLLSGFILSRLMSSSKFWDYELGFFQFLQFSN